MRFKYVRTRAHTRTSHIFLRSLRNSLWNWPLQLKRNIHTKRPPKLLYFVGHWAFMWMCSFFRLSFMNLVVGWTFVLRLVVVVVAAFAGYFGVCNAFVFQHIFCSWIHHNLNPTYLNCHVSANARKRQHEKERNKERTFVTIHISVQLYG